MAYYTSGYQYNVPIGYQSRAGVAALQQEMNLSGAGLRVDGIWGPKTDAAYGAYTGGGTAGRTAGVSPYGGTSGFTGTDLQALYNQVYGLLTPQTISYSMPSRSQLASENAGILRPAYDHAITQRQQQTLHNRAEIDVDAASRGMGRSSYVTDVKDRAMDDEAADIARMEGEYAAALAAAVQEQYDRHLANKLAADQYNAQALSAAQNAAFGYATTLYGNNLSNAQAMAQAMAGAAKGGSRSGRTTAASLGSASKAELQHTAYGLYASTANSTELARLIQDIRATKPYDGKYPAGASEYLAGVLSGLL